MSEARDLIRRGREIPEDDRLAHRWFAIENGFFWANCVLCGREWGGHEWRDIDGKPGAIPDPESGPGSFMGICPDCTRAGRGLVSLGS